MPVNAISSSAAMTYSYSATSVSISAGSTSGNSGAAQTGDSVELSSESLDLSALLDQSGAGEEAANPTTDSQMLEMIVAMALLACLMNQGDSSDITSKLLDLIGGGQQQQPAGDAASSSFSMQYTSTSVSMDFSSAGSSVDVAA